MIGPTRMLCQKYTDLTDEEIAYIESYEPLLPALANAEEADVFIDCRTSTGRSAIVVCEAKPQTVPSNYERAILGMLIQWRDEPAVDRSFRLGVPTVGLRAVSMPEDRRIVQSVEPIFFRERLIAVLIYEKPAPAAEDMVVRQGFGQDETAELDWAGVSDGLDEAVIFLDGAGKVCGHNQSAAQLYRDMGYVGSLLGMPESNIQPVAQAECDGRWHEASVVDRTLLCRRVPISRGSAKTALLLRDITARRRLEQELAFQQTALRELRHRMKNSLQMLAGLARSRSYETADPAGAQTALRDMAGRLLSLTATLDGVVQLSPEKVSLLQVLERVRKYTLQTLLTPARDIVIRVWGEEAAVSADCAASVALVVNELLQNALKHAFPAGAAGEVSIRLQVQRPLCTVTVSDNGTGFRPEAGRPGGMGLELASTIVREKLLGEWAVETSAGGTRITFDFLEQ